MIRRRACLTKTLILIAAAAVPANAQTVLPVEQQVVAAVLPLPSDMRAGATVLGYNAGATALSVLKKGTNGMTCLAPDPKREQFHVACYHDSMEPFMLRGRELRAKGMTKIEQVDSTRFAEIKSGKLSLPKIPASLYSLTGPAGSFDAATGEAKGARKLFVVYMPYATTATTGIPTTGKPGEPWLMFPGTPKAHIMLIGSM